ncbi:MAG: hypothetical protein NC204_00320 [Candidatus Amulumruptor caecigallinarius]|nr:hypothetical protein [Candidatus Amulumruptor caecigallinarius]
MKIKTLLTAVFLALSCITAAAFPTYTVNPAAGTLNSSYYFANINMVFSSNVTKASDAKAYLIHLESGEELTSTDIVDMSRLQARTFGIKFDDSKILKNGAWMLRVPEGTFLSNGEGNPKIELNYTLSDPNIIEEEFAPITLISANPEAGSTIMAFGRDYINQVSFKTSNNSSVNYIGWKIYDVTDPDDPKYVTEGNENRFDLNRTGKKNFDQWANKDPFITIGGEGHKLMKGHKFEMQLMFCGIGYDEATNQYPTPEQREKSKLLETSVIYLGGMEPTKYSPYVVESVSPDPENYRINSYDFPFTVFYSGPVKPKSFIYAKEQNVTPTAGTWEPVGTADVDGYAKAWQFKFYDGILEEIVGTANVTITAEDKNGLPVKGSGDYDFDNFNYSIYWLCNLGATALTCVNPSAGSAVTELSEITISNSDNKAMEYMSGTATIVRNKELVRTLSAPEAVSTSQMKWTFEPITTPGTYTLMIPDNYFSVGSDQSSTYNNETSFSFMIESPDETLFDVIPSTVDPADGSTVEKIDIIKVGIPSGYDIIRNSKGDIVTKANVYKVLANGNEGVVETGIVAVESEEKDPEYEFYPLYAVFNLKNAVTTPGSYRVVIEKGLLGDDDYSAGIMDGKGGGHATPELRYTYTIADGGSGEEPGPSGDKYKVDFDTPIDTSDPEFIVAEGWGHIADLPENTKYTYNATGGFYGSGCLTVPEQDGIYDWSTMETIDYNDMLVTPLVKGEVSIKVRAILGYYKDTKLRVYELDSEGNVVKLVKEFDRKTDNLGYTDSDSEADQWKKVILVPANESTEFKKYGLRFSKMDIDDFEADEVLLGELPPIGETAYDAAPASVDPADGSSVKAIEKVTLGIPEGFNIIKNSEGNPVAKANLYALNENESETLVEGELTPVESEEKNEDTGKPLYAIFNLKNAVSAEGTYSIVIEKGLLGDDDHAAAVAEGNGAGHATPELRYTFTVKSNGEDPGVEIVEGYVVDFNTPIDTSNPEFAVAEGWGHITDNLPASYQYSYSSTGGVQNSGYLSVPEQDGFTDWSTWESIDYDDMLVTPLVKGEVSIKVRAILGYYKDTKLRVYELDSEGNVVKLVKEFDRKTDNLGYTDSDSEADQWKKVILVPANESTEFKKYGLRFSKMDIDDFEAEFMMIKTNVETVNVSGTVYLGEQPAAGAEVKFVSADEDMVTYTATAAADGTYSVDIAEKDRAYNVYAKLSEKEDMVLGYTLEESENILNLHLLDVVEIDNTVGDHNPSEAAIVKLNLTLNEGFNNIVLPVNMDSNETKAAFGDNVYVYSKSFLDETGTELTLHFKHTNEIVAGNHYIVKLDGAPESVMLRGKKVIGEVSEVEITDIMSNEAPEVATLHGTYSHLGMESGMHLLNNYKDTNERAYAPNYMNTESTVAPYASFVKLLDNEKGGKVQSVSFSVGDYPLPTGVENIPTVDVNENDVVYTLTGIRVKNPSKGLYIVNGRKAFVK